MRHVGRAPRGWIMDSQDTDPPELSSGETYIALAQDLAGVSLGVGTRE